ncbi:MAG TPA: DNA-binding response regulator [Bacteroidales bacterium]|nr:MAG: hypothetical protein A2X11_10725 [Bacteroidetes bacterium GWE2_42_24]PKP17270.1 MAG: DNA-binding response regulator [Bacteroidetes bacterium HGW-Bacteroidetes-22]HAQ64531.1 DNA-binding response regulator [Bacteroidales bacterium]HBZ65532.1 DNA-binding response regulator [Bacteroidales bacterium]
MENKISVMIIDDHQLIIDGIRSLLQDEPDLIFAGGANNLHQALDIIEKNVVDVALVDISMPEISGIEITRRIKETSPSVSIIALTMYEDVQMITQMIEAGASGYIFKRTSMKEVIEAIRTAARGEKYLSNAVQAVLMDSIKLRNEKPESVVSPKAKLSGRELEILNLLAQEMSNEEIAGKLFISERTVETHRRNIFTKTQTKSVVGLIKFAMKEGLI